MSTSETDLEAAAEAAFCEHCGAPVGGGRFCRECGNELAPGEERSSGNGAPDAISPADASATPPREPDEYGAVDPWSAPRPDAATEVHRPVAAAPAAPAVGQRRPWPIVIAVAVALALIAGGVTAYLMGSDDGASDETAYRERVAAAFGPVLGANRELSTEMARVRGTKPTDARLAARRAQQATTMAQGALNALSVPAGSAQLERDSRQVLDRQAAYLGAVSAVLANPSSASRSQLQTLASNLTSAFSAAGPTVAGTEQTVSGADRLTAWAPRAARTLRRRARAERRRRAARDAGGRAAAPGPAPSSPSAGGRDCGGGLYAGPNTTCVFAAQVREAYYEAPGSTASVRAYSPATGQTYTMNCAPSGSGITCSGGNNASVTF